jgi:hypothetical protein
MMMDAAIYKLTPAEEEEVMAGHATLRALAEEHCFASNTGLAWRVANDILRLPKPTMRQHFDDSDTKLYGELRRRDDCPTAPASLIAFVVHPRQRHARLTRLAHGRRPERQPRWARAAARLRDLRDLPGFGAELLCTQRQAHRSPPRGLLPTSLHEDGLGRLRL